MKKFTTFALTFIVIISFFLTSCTFQSEKYLTVSQSENKSTSIASIAREGGTTGSIILDDIDAIPELCTSNTGSSFNATTNANGCLILPTVNVSACNNENACLVVYQLWEGNAFGEKSAKVYKELSFPMNLNAQLGCLASNATYKISFLPVNRNSTQYIDNVLPNEATTYCELCQ